MRRLALALSVVLALPPDIAAAGDAAAPAPMPVPLAGDWRPDPATRCLPAPEGAATPVQDRLEGILARIEALGPKPDPLIAGVRAAGIALCLEDRRMEARGYFEPALDLIMLDDGLSDDLMFLILVHELRHVDQHGRGFCPSVAFARSEMPRLLFAMEADAQAIATLYAWRARAAGDPGPWEVLRALPNYGDIAERFAEAAGAGGDEAAAVAAAFAAWYEEPWRTTAYYLAACAGYYDALDRQHALPSDDLLPADYFDTFCQLPGGLPYDCRIETPERP